MRILLNAASDAQLLYLGKALVESLHSVETTDKLRYVRYLLTQESFDAVVICTSGEEQLDELLAEVQTLRGHAPSVPLVMLFPHLIPADCARFLRAGADACFVQPYSLLEIGERLRILARTAGVPAPVAHRRKRVRLEPSTRTFVDGDHPILLTRREYLLLECLLRSKGLPVSRDHLIHYVWPEKEDVEPGSLNRMILRLRRKLRAGKAHSVVQTVNHHGYCLLLEAETNAEPEDEQNLIGMPITPQPDSGDNLSAAEASL